MTETSLNTGSQINAEDVSERIMSHHLSGLQASAVYEALVQTRNKFGWSDVSISLHTTDQIYNDNAEGLVLLKVLFTYHPQVSDTFQFRTQRSGREPRVEGVGQMISAIFRSDANREMGLPLVITAIVVHLAVEWTREKGD